MHTTRFPRAQSAIVAVLLLAACKKTAPADAFGNFEAEEVVVAAETSGQLLRFDLVEGQAVVAKGTAGLVDTIQLGLEQAQLAAQRAGITDHRTEAREQLRALEVQHEIARRTRERVDRLFGSQAATVQQRDQAEREERVLGLQAVSARAGLARIATETTGLDARVAAVRDRIRRATLTVPVSGTVLATYVRAGEVIQPGQPLYRVAPLDTMTLRAYVTGGQLQAFRIGQVVQVHVDGADGALRAYTGTVSWVSSKAEFTPTPVQTRDERDNLVYAVKVRVANPDGALKIGMPGDMALDAAPGTVPGPAAPGPAAPRPAAPGPAAPRSRTP